MQRFSNVLIVDDNVSIRAALGHDLSEAGYTVRSATNGVDALKLIEESCPDYVITDWRMPNMNGHSLCRSIRAQDLKEYVYIILMTGYDELPNLIDGLDAGADDYLLKPVDMRELLARMKAGARVLKLDRHLRKIARQDPLTGVLNRRDWISTIDEIIETSMRHGKPRLSCLMLDLDHFKSVNDRFGHVVGDQVLVQVAEVLGEEFREADFLFRYGGEEFAVILPDCDEAEAAKCADRCRRSIEAKVCSKEAEGLVVTASIGVGESKEGDSALDLISRVDSALLQAKRNGRNRVVKWSDSASVSPLGLKPVGSNLIPTY